MFVRLKIKELLKDRRITQKELARRSGLREATISEMANNIRNDINKDHLIRIIQVLGVFRIEDIIEIVE